MSATAWSAGDSPLCRRTRLNTSNRLRVGTMSRDVSSIAGRKSRRSCRSRSTRASSTSPPRSQAITATLDRPVNASQKAPHFLGPAHGDELDAVLVGDGLDFLPRPQAQQVADGLGDHDLELRGNGYRCHTNPVSILKSSYQDYIDATSPSKRSAGGDVRCQERALVVTRMFATISIVQSLVLSIARV